MPRVKYKQFLMRRHRNLGRGYAVEAPPKIVIQLVLAIERPDVEFAEAWRQL